ncbi:MAG: flagellar biosynthesis protein FlgA [Verrucomicrobiota bacterium]|jgi:flagellar P-ring protein precursor FlgI
MKTYLSAACLGLSLSLAAFQAQPEASPAPKPPLNLPLPQLNPSAANDDKSVTLMIKNASILKGHEDRILVGSGIVTGLAGTGDSDKKLTQHMLANALKSMRIDVPESELKVGNCAAVSLEVKINGSGASGTQYDVVVSTMGDAKSLKGGTLLLSPLLGPDREIWGVAAGRVVTNGFTFGDTADGGDKTTKNHPNVGIVSNGMKLVRDVGVDFSEAKELCFRLRNPDYGNASRMTEAINQIFFGAATASSDAEILVRVPPSVRAERKVADYIGRLQEIQFRSSQPPARIVYNESSGNIVITGDVKISPMAITKGNLVINIKNTPQVSQPGALSEGTTQVVNDQTTTVTEDKARLVDFAAITNLSDLSAALNKLGVSPSDMISIFQTLRQSGALHAELISQ